MRSIFYRKKKEIVSLLLPHGFEGKEGSIEFECGSLPSWEKKDKNQTFLGKNVQK
jgi:hypothetical protein